MLKEKADLTASAGREKFNVQTFLEKWMADDLAKGLGPNPFAKDLKAEHSLHR